MSRNVYNFSNAKNNIFSYPVLTLAFKKGMLDRMVQRLFWRRGCQREFRGYKYLKSLPFSLEHVSFLRSARSCIFSPLQPTRKIIMVDVFETIPVMEDTDLNSIQIILIKTFFIRLSC